MKQQLKQFSQTGSNTKCLLNGYVGNHYWEYPVWVGGDINGSGYWSGDLMRCKLCGLTTKPVNEVLMTD